MSAFNSFTYINSDTLSKLADLQHNISDTQGRPTFSVFGFVPVYDYRLDSTGDSPFTYKFGEKDTVNGNITKFPSSNINTQPFTTLVNKLDGILFADDIYMWRPPGASSGVSSRVYNQDDKYRLIKTSNDYVGGSSDASHFIIAMGYWECVDVTDVAYTNMIGKVRFEKNLIDGTLPGEQLRLDVGTYDEGTSTWSGLVGGGLAGTVINTEVPESLWIYRSTNTTTIDTATVLNNVPVRDDFGVAVFGDKIITPRGNAWIWQLKNAAATSSVANVDYDVTQEAIYGSTIADNKNKATPNFAAISSVNTALRDWQRFDDQNQTKIFNSNQFIIGYATTDSLGNQIDYNNRIVDLDLLKGQGFNMFQNIR